MPGPIQYSRLLGRWPSPSNGQGAGIVPCQTEPFPQASGALLFACVAHVNRPGVVPTVFTSRGNSLTLVGRVPLGTWPTVTPQTDGFYLDLWAANNLAVGQQLSAAAGDYIKWLWPGSDSYFVYDAYADEFTAFATLEPYVDGGAGSTGGGTAVDSGFATVGDAGDLLYGLVAVLDGQGPVFTLSSPNFWTAQARVASTLLTNPPTLFLYPNYAGVLNYPLPGSTYKINGTITSAASPPTWAALLVGFRPETKLKGAARGGSNCAGTIGRTFQGAAAGVGAAAGRLTLTTSFGHLDYLVGVGRSSGTIGRTFQGRSVGVGLASGTLKPVPKLPPCYMTGVGRSAGTIGKTFRGAGVGAGVATGRLGPAFIPLTGPFGLFTTLGHIVGLIQAINLHRGTDEVTRVNTIYGDFDNLRDVLPDQLFKQLASDQGGRGTFVKALQSLAQRTLIAMANASVPLPALTAANALAELIRQMLLKNHTVKTSAVGIGYGPAKNPKPNAGNPAFAFSLRDDYGLLLETVFAEHVQATCAADSQASGSAGQETLQARSELDEADELAYDWPAGSGADVTLTACDEGDGNKLRGNSLLQNGGFDAAQGGQPAQWTTVYGSWDAQAGNLALDNQPAVPGGPAMVWKRSLSVRCTGLAGDDLVLHPPGGGTGHPPAEFRQAFKKGVLKPLTTYGVNCWVAADPAAGSNAGTLELALVSPSTGAVTSLGVQAIPDESGNANSLTAALANWPSTFAPLSGAFRTPRRLAGDETLTVRVIGALPAGRRAWVDSLTVCTMTRLYAGGPFVSVHAGSQAMIAGDQWTIQVTNDRAGQWQTWFDRLFDMRGLGLLLPSSGTPDIPDNLII